jgi:trk system potassium uptake protein TrkA
MRIVVIGAGQVGSTIVEALHDEHELTVVDLDPRRLARIARRYDVLTREGNGASRRTLADAGVKEAHLAIACTSRDETNLVAAMFSKKLSPRTTSVMRASNVEYLELWREGQLDVDFIVSAELETAHVISRMIGVPAARQTDVFANGQVQIVEFEIPPNCAPGLVDVPLRDAAIPPDSKVASIIRGEETLLPRGDATLRAGDRIVVIGSPRAAQQWSILMGSATGRVEDVVVYGGGRLGTAIASLLLEQGLGVRLIEPDPVRARSVAELLPGVRVYQATGLDADFLERERIGDVQAAVFAMGEDERNHFAAALAKVHGVGFTIATVHDAASIPVYEATGVDATVDPRAVTAEEIVRFAHDPRTQQVAMFEGTRYEVLDIVTKPDSEYVGKRFRDMPIRGALIGAVVRNDEAIFPHGDDVLQAGDRVIVFTESRRAPVVEQAL